MLMAQGQEVSHQDNTTPISTLAKHQGAGNQLHSHRSRAVLQRSAQMSSQVNMTTKGVRAQKTREMVGQVNDSGCI